MTRFIFATVMAPDSVSTTEHSGSVTMAEGLDLKSVGSEFLGNLLISRLLARGELDDDRHQQTLALDLRPRAALDMDIE